MIVKTKRFYSWRFYFYQKSRGWQDVTNKQQRFVEEYLVDLNATQAAIRAGYSPVSANQTAADNMAKPCVSNAIARAMAERSKRTGVTVDRVVRELAKIGFADISDVASFDNGDLRQETHRDDTAAIQTLRVKRTITDDGEVVEREVRMYDKGKALDMLSRHLGMFDNRFKLEGEFQVTFSGENKLAE